jgi:hypothetical protein
LTGLCIYLYRSRSLTYDCELELKLAEQNLNPGSSFHVYKWLHACRVGICDIHVKQKISVINEMRQKNFKTESLGLRKTLLNTVNFCLSSGRSFPNFRPFFMP